MTKKVSISATKKSNQEMSPSTQQELKGNSSLQQKLFEHVLDSSNWPPHGHIGVKLDNGCAVFPGDQLKTQSGYFGRMLSSEQAGPWVERDNSFYNIEDIDEEVMLIMQAWLEKNWLDPTDSRNINIFVLRDKQDSSEERAAAIELLLACYIAGDYLTVPSFCNDIVDFLLMDYLMVDCGELDSTHVEMILNNTTDAPRRLRLVLVHAIFSKKAQMTLEDAISKGVIGKKEFAPEHFAHSRMSLLNTDFCTYHDHPKIAHCVKRYMWDNVHAVNGDARW